MLSITDRVGIPRHEILLRVDSGHDATEYIQACVDAQIHFIIKRNLRWKDAYNEYLREWMPYVKRNVEPVKKKNPDIKIYYYTEETPSHGVKGEGVFSFSIFTEKEKDFTQQHFEIVSSDPMYGREPWIERTVDSFVTNVPVMDSSLEPSVNPKHSILECQKIYKDHTTRKQFLAEEKREMGIELLPSHLFKTNDMLLQLSAITFNIARLISDRAARETIA